jgi:hypothetical protein
MLYQHLTYTTLDELNFVRALARNSNVSVSFRLRMLRTQLRLAPVRVWFGQGMAVDVMQVIRELELLIKELQETQAFAARPAHPDVL